jgi:hypothetical protein
MYRIKKYTLDQAQKLGVQVKPSRSAGKKIDVYKNGLFIVSIGAIDYNDFPTYLEREKQGKEPKGTAEQRRKLYKIRHAKDRAVKNSAGYYADKLLW